MIYMGIDLSLTGTGILIIDDNGTVIIKQLVKTLNKEKILGTKPIQYIDILPEDRIIKILNVVKNLCETNKPNIIYIEGLSFGSQGRSVLELGGLHYCIKVYLKTENYNYKTIPPKTLKKKITGNGNANKETMILKVFKKYGEEFSDNNLCDAYCLARCALDKLI